MPVTVTWYGHGTFGIEADGKQVLLDPFFTGNPAVPQDVNVDDLNPSTILITHAHNDHVGDVFSIAKRSGAKVITINELANFLKNKGLENVVGGNHGGTIAFEGGSAKIVPAWHSSSYNDDDGSVVAPGIPAGLVVRFGGKTLYFAGDTALFGDMALIGEEGLDLAVLPIGDHFTMGPADAVRAAKLLNAKYVMPGHYNTFPLLQQDGQQFKTDLEAVTTSKGIILNPGESTEID